MKRELKRCHLCPVKSKPIRKTKTTFQLLNAPAPLPFLRPQTPYPLFRPAAPCLTVPFCPQCPFTVIRPLYLGSPTSLLWGSFQTPSSALHASAFLPVGHTQHAGLSSPGSIVLVRLSSVAGGTTPGLLVHGWVSGVTIHVPGTWWALRQGDCGLVRVTEHRTWCWAPRMQRQAKRHSASSHRGCDPP